MDKNYQIIALALVAGLLVGFFVGRMTVSDNTSKDTTLDKEVLDGSAAISDFQLNNDGEVLVIQADGSIVNVKDQKAGSNVFISRVELTKDGWVAIREVEGNILGAGRFDKGVHQDSVVLLRDTVVGQQYYAVLYADDGDKLFNFEKDPIIVDISGNPISMMFEVY